nr:glycine--tRNA ligase subunit beta [Coxiella-like endosymbiont]
MIFGKDVVPTTILGHMTSAETRGHHFHYPQRIAISQPDDYQRVLLTHGMVIADFEKRLKKFGF